MTIGDMAVCAGLRVVGDAYRGELPDGLHVLIADTQGGLPTDAEAPCVLSLYSGEGKIDTEECLTFDSALITLRILTVGLTPCRVEPVGF